MASAINMLGDVHGGAGEQCVALYNAIAARLGDGAVSAARLAQAVGAEMTSLAAQGVSRMFPASVIAFTPAIHARPACSSSSMPQRSAAR